MALSRAKLKCYYTNTWSMGNKHKELEMCTHLFGDDNIGITEIWWVAAVTRALEWKVSGILGRTD